MAGARDRDDGETAAMLFDGGSVSQIRRLFGMDARDVAEKLREVPPSGTRRGFPIWRVKDAARVLVKPEVTEDQIVSYIAGMNFRELPAALNKEVWNGLRARLRFEQEQGDLWKTERVQEIVNKLMQTFRMGMLLMPDRVNRVEELTPKQREAFQKLVDEMLNDMRQQVREAMQEVQPMTPGIMDYAKEDDDASDVEAGPEDDVPETVEEDFDL